MRNSCKPYRLLSDDTVGYAAQWPADDAAAPHRHNWIIRRDPLIVVSGDLPAWGLMAAERGPTVSPPFFVYALVRAGVVFDGQTYWLDETKALEVQYHPWCSEHRLTLPGGLHLAIACTAWKNRGAMLQFRVEGPLPATAELLVEVQGLGTAVQSWSASFVKQELVVWHPGQSQAEGARASMRGTISRSIVDAADTYGPGGFSLPPQRAIELAASAGQWETLPDQRLLLRLPLAEGALHEIGLVVGDDGSDLRFPGFAAAEQETREHYRHVLALCHSRTPDARLDAALAAAVVSLDQGRDGKAWLEGVTRWNTRWANNYQIGAAVAMGCVGDAREALLEMADVERGPGQILMSDGRSWVWSDDALPYYMLQWHRYNEATGDDLETQLAGPVGRSFERFMATRDLAGTGLAGWTATPPDPPSRLYWWSVALFIAMAGGWLGFRTLRLAPAIGRRIVFVGMGVALVAVAVTLGVRLTDRGPINWTYYTPERLQQASASQKVIVLEFTAEWCLNCHALEQAVLRQPAVVELLNRPDVAAIKVDITGNNEDGDRKLVEVGRRSIPYLVIYDPAGRRVFSSDAYTVEQVTRAMQKAFGSTSGP